MNILVAAAISLIPLSVPLYSAIPTTHMIQAETVFHGGGLNRDGCHNDRKRDTYHCH
jgi:hypothetical protein